MMGRYRMAMRPIHRIKHVVDSNAQLASGVQLDIELVKTVDAPVLANTAQVETGAKVNGIYLRVEVGSNEVATVGAVPQCYLAVWKNPGDSIAIADISAVGADKDKRFVIHQEMMMIENTGKGGNPRTLFNGVIAIPKGYRRFGPDDRLECSIRSPSLDIVFCIQCHYKEFR